MKDDDDRHDQQSNTQRKKKKMTEGKNSHGREKRTRNSGHADPPPRKAADSASTHQNPSHQSFSLGNTQGSSSSTHSSESATLQPEHSPQNSDQLPSSSATSPQQHPGEDVAASLPQQGRVAPPVRQETRVRCQYCGREFKNLQGHSCPQKQAALGHPVVVNPDTSVSVRNWPFQSLAEIEYKDIFCSPLTVGRCTS